MHALYGDSLGYFLLPSCLDSLNHYLRAHAGQTDVVERISVAIVGAGATGVELAAELHNAAEHEMIVKLDDFMRRRSKIDLVVHDDDIRSSPGLHEVAEILFGGRADERLAEYFAEKAPIG